MIFLKQSTAINIKLGPFLDENDGVTALTGLSLTVKLSKNGGTIAARNSAGAIAHDADGYYTVPLDATDTDTAGRLKSSAAPATSLPVWQEYMVLTANAYDSLVSGTDSLQVDTIEVSGDSTAADNLELMYDGTGYDAANSTIGTVTTNTDMLLATAIVTNGAIATTAGAVDTVTDVTNQVTADVTAISGDSVAADNMELWFDNTGYNASNSSVGVSVDENAIAAAVAAALTNTALTFITPLSSDGLTMEVVIGDTYANADSRAFDWTSDDWADLTGATGVVWNAWHINKRNETYSVAMSVITAGSGTQKVRLELPAATTADFNEARRDYRFAVVATLASGNKATLVGGVNTYMQTIRAS